MRVLYRVRQFWTNLAGRPSAAGLAQAQALLGPELFALFQKMQPGEQAHSLQVFSNLRAQGENDPNLLAAALLHDVGKARFPLRIWERILVVLGKKLLPGRYEHWSQGDAQGWKRAFVIAGQHPEWGAEMAAAAGASPGAVSLIRRHQIKTPKTPLSENDRQLHMLQRFDDSN